MSVSINKIFVAGNVTKDPEIKTLQSGVKVAVFNVATSEGGYKNKEGKDVPEQTQFHRVIAWRGLGELAEKAIKKGIRVTVEGKMTYRTWFDEEDVQKKNRHDVAEIIADNIVIGGSKSQNVSMEQLDAPIEDPDAPEQKSEQAAAPSEAPITNAPVPDPMAADPTLFGNEPSPEDDLPF